MNPQECRRAGMKADHVGGGHMKWWVRMMAGLLLLMSLMACENVGLTGDPCKLKEKASVENAQALKDKARIIENNFNCRLPFCILNYFDPAKLGEGYCTAYCESVGDCPNSTEWTCEVFLNVEKLPPEYQQFSPLVGRKLCVRVPPTPSGN